MIKRRSTAILSNFELLPIHLTPPPCPPFLFRVEAAAPSSKIWAVSLPFLSPQPTSASQHHPSPLPRPTTVCFVILSQRLLSVQLLGGSDPRRGHLQADLAALRQEDVHGLLRVLSELSLHALDVFVRLRLELRGGVAAGAAFFVHIVCARKMSDCNLHYNPTKLAATMPLTTCAGSLVEGVLLLHPVGGDELVGIGLRLLHSVPAS